jgi:heme-degrading monooxygenase HmoA
MFCVIYQWKVKPGKEEEFRESWRAVTDAIYHQHGSLGSRLHKNDDGTWVAYAQWPTRELWESGAELLDVAVARAKWHDAIESESQVVFKLMVTDDMLRAQPFTLS